jgi:hypothetical protein
MGDNEQDRVHVNAGVGKMLMALIVITVLAGAGWLLLPGIWRGRKPAHYGRGNDGLLASNRRGVLPALLGVTAFLVSGWTMFLAGQPRPGGQVPAAGRVTAGWIFLLGVAFILCYVSIYISGRPRFLVPPSMRPGRAMAMDPGQPGGGFVPGTHQANPCDRTETWAALQPGETLYARIGANHVQDGRAYGGHVTVTSNRLVFEPVALSQARGGARWEVPLTQVTSADVAPRGWNTRTGAWRHRLRVRTMTGDVEYFVVWRPRRAANQIEQARQNQP